jgi:hypothetical protein
MVARSPTLSLCVAVYYKLARPRFASRDGALPAVKVKVRSRVTDLSTGTDPHRHTAQPKRQVATVLVHGNQFFESDGPIPRLCSALFLRQQFLQRQRLSCETRTTATDKVLLLRRRTGGWLVLRLHELSIRSQRREHASAAPQTSKHPRQTSKHP